MDVGMHTGEDTARFLAAGFRVIAIEANPALVEEASRTFAEAISNGRLTIIGAAISEQHGPVSLAVADHTVWSTLDPSLIERNERENGTVYRRVEVPGIPFDDVVSEFGVPFYLKIDIEGLDMVCVRTLHRRDEKPPYISLETAATTNHASGTETLEELRQLWSLGYRRFRYVEQRARHVVHTAEDPTPTDDGWPGPPWLPIAGALVVSQALRLHHRFSGMGGQWRDTLPGRAYRYARWRLKLSPTWYDLQAAR